MRREDQDRAVITLVDSGGTVIYDGVSGDIRGVILTSATRLAELDQLDGPYCFAGYDPADQTYTYMVTWPRSTGAALARLCATWYDDQERLDRHRGESISITDAVTGEKEKALEHLRRAATLSGRTNRDRLDDVIHQLETDTQEE